MCFVALLGMYWGCARLCMCAGAAQILLGLRMGPRKVLCRDCCGAVPGLYDGWRGLCRGCAGTVQRGCLGRWMVFYMSFPECIAIKCELSSHTQLYWGLPSVASHISHCPCGSSCLRALCLPWCGFDGCCEPVRPSWPFV